MDRLDKIIQEHPIKAPVRKGLTDSTLEAMVQVKRIHFAERIQAILFVIASVLLIAQWINNDIFYLIQLSLQKFAIIKNLSDLYLAALWESLPKQQLFTMLLAGIFWLGWIRVETFLIHNRIKNNRQGLLMRIIQLTPRLVVINTLIVTLAVGYAGYSYAQKSQQQKLQILKQHINQTGRIEFETNRTAETCDATNNPNLTNQYEIKRGTTTKTTDAVDIIEAKCNANEAENFLKKMFPAKLGVDYRTEENGTTIVSQILDKDVSTFRVVESYTSNNLDENHHTYMMEKDTKVFKEKTFVPVTSLKKGDIVMLMLNHQYENRGENSQQVKTKVVGVYILPAEPNFKWYDLTIQSTVTQIKTCQSNPQDRCSFTGSIDFFPSGGGESNTKNPVYKQIAHGELKEIAGTLENIGENEVKIKSSSGRMFTIIFGSDPVGDFNRDRAQYYDNDKVTLGDTLLVTYIEPSDQHATTIQTEQIFNAVLMVEFTDKTQQIKQY